MKTAKTPGLLTALAGLLVSVSLNCPAQAQGPVDFRDAGLKAAVEAALGKTNPTASDMLALRDLSAPNKSIIDLTGLEYATNLTTLYLGANQLSDLSPLSGLTNLTWLELSWNQLSDISPLASLTKLSWLELTWNHISDISALGGLTSLSWLYLQGNKITDIGPLAGLTELMWLELTGNQVGDLAPLDGLNKLTGLQLTWTGISDLSALDGLTNLTALYLGGNEISDLSPLAGLTKLGGLELWENEIADLSPLAGLTQLTALQLRDNQIVDISPLAGSRALTSLELERNQIRDISALAGLTRLKQLNLAWNQIDIVSPLAGLADLTEVQLEQNQITDISPLVGLMKLRRLTVQDNLLDCRVCGASLSRIRANNPGIYLRPESCIARVALTLSSTEGGVVSIPGPGAFEYDWGYVLTVVAKAAPGRQFVAWTGTAVTAGKVADPNTPRTTVTLDDDYTLQATFEETVWQFQERWETAAPGAYTPSKSAAFDADEGPWALGDGISSSGACGATPNRAEVVTLDHSQALLLKSIDGGRACSEAVWIALNQSGSGEGPLVIDPNTVIHFNEVGRLDAPGAQGSGGDCEDPPCFDNVSLLVTDGRGNSLAYVLQRAADANVPNSFVGDTYREIFLDRSGVNYQRNLFIDFNTVPDFNSVDARVTTIEFRVAEHGSAIIDDIAIGPADISGRLAVYHFWSPTLETHFFTIGPQEKQYLIDVWPGTWTFQGISYFTLPQGSDPNLTPVYRFWSPTMSSHFYTISEAERDNLVANYPEDWSLEGIAFHVFAMGRQPPDAVPVYRFWSGSLGAHFYTADVEERDEMVRNHSDVWLLEGVAWYAYPPQWDSQKALEIIGSK